MNGRSLWVGVAMRGLTLTLMLLAALPLLAQRYDDTVTVNVIEVPVYVDRFGTPIADLAAEDFELFIDGQPHPIEYFDVIDAGRASAGPGAEEAEEAPDLKRRNLIVLLFDMGGTSPWGLHRARKMAVQYVNESPSDVAYAVAVISRVGVRFVVPFTTDRVAVTRAIGTLSRSKAADPFHVATLEAERTAWRGEAGGVHSLPEFPDAGRVMREWSLEGPSLEDWLLAEDLAGLARQLAPLSGIKRVVLLSERPGSWSPLYMFDPGELVRDPFRAAGVILDGIDMRLPSVPGGVSSTGAYHVPGSTMLSPYLYAVAGATGGAVDASLQGLQKRNRVTYVLGFRPPPGKKTGSIRVGLKERRLFAEVRHRRSFALDESEPKDNWLFLADTLLNDIPQRSVTLDLDVDGTSVVAKIPGVELLAYPNDEPLVLDVFLYVFDRQQQPAAWKHVRVEVDLVKGRDFLMANPYAVRQVLQLPPGTYTAKVIVRVAGTDKTGFARADFVTP